MLQWTPEEVAGQSMHALHHHTRADGTPYPREACPIHAAFRDGAVHHVADEVFWRRDGTSFPVEYVSSPIRDAQGRLQGAVVSFDDISERKAAEKALARAVRALKTLSAGNEALVRAASEEELLQAAVRIIVEQGGYRLATIGFAGDDPEKTITPVVWAGAEEGYYAQERLTWADTERGQVPIARAIRNGTPQVCRDIANDAGFAPWRESALARGYASNIVLPLHDGGRCFGGLSIYSAEKDAFDAEEAQLLTELGNDLAYGIVTLRTRAERDRIAHAHVHHAEILQKSLEQSIQAIADTVESRDPYTAGHQRRVGGLAVAIAREMGLPEETIHGIRLAATIHDLGKIHIPAEILAKPGKLSDIEFMLIKTHPQAGYDILKDIDFPWPIADMVWQHHEKLDGSGYPQGLKGGQIRLESRIMTVADVVEAMSSHRPYRASLGIEVALKEIERGRGSAYDAAVADACLKLFREERFTFAS
ncbi:MAG: GAF domain-containing protein [Sulfuritalea sp.]|nr:GAF domain-containing protein [Sulfuritalea sp.]